MTTKERAIETISQMPDDATIGDIMAELYVQLKIEKGLQQLDAGEVISHEEAMKRLSKWLT